MVNGQCQVLVDLVLGKEVVDSIDVLQNYELALKLPMKEISVTLVLKVDSLLT